MLRSLLCPVKVNLVAAVWESLVCFFCCVLFKFAWKKQGNVNIWATRRGLMEKLRCWFELVWAESCTTGSLCLSIHHHGNLPALEQVMFNIRDQQVWNQHLSTEVFHWWEICIHRFSVFVLSTSLYDPKTSQLFCFYSQSVLALTLVNTTRPAAERIKTKTAWHTFKYWT